VNYLRSYSVLTCLSAAVYLHGHTVGKEQTVCRKTGWWPAANSTKLQTAFSRGKYYDVANTLCQTLHITAHCCGWLHNTSYNSKSKIVPVIQHEAVKKYRGVEVELHAFWTSVLQASSQKRTENYIKENECKEEKLLWALSDLLQLPLSCCFSHPTLQLMEHLSEDFWARAISDTLHAS